MREAVKSGVTKVSLSPIDRLTSNAQVAHAVKYNFNPEIKTFGTIVAPETGFRVLTSWVEGRVEKFYVQETGVYLNKGAPLIDVYSPMLVEAQQEFLVSVKAKKKLGSAGYSGLSENTDKLIESGRRKLKLLGMVDKQIDLLESDGKVVDKVTIYARQGGIVMELMTTQGMYLMEGGEILEVASLSPIWAELEVYEQDISKVQIGDTVSLNVSSLGGNVVATGPVTLLLPEVDEMTRTLKIRAEVNNPGMKLRPGMFVEGRILKKTGESVLVIPRDAVLFGGKGAKVWVPTASDPNEFVSKEVKIGRTLGEKGDLLEVTEGLREGQTVIRGAVFLVDSEAELMNVSAAGGSDRAGENAPQGEGGGGGGSAANPHAGHGG